MIRLDLSAGPKWLDLGAGLRLHVLPVTTAIMVAARNDPVVEALPEGASKFEAFPDPLPRATLGAGAGKERLRALAEWHFGGGESYCAACQRPCPDCPGRLNRPQTLDG